MRNVSDRSSRGNQNTFYVQNFSENCAVYEMWKNMLRVRCATDDDILLYMHFAYRITKERIETHTTQNI